jgi:hypothetical protein
MAGSNCPFCETELFRDTVLAGGRCPACMRNLPEDFAVDELPSSKPAKPPQPAGAAEEAPPPPAPGGAWYPVRSGLRLLYWGLGLYGVFAGLAALVLLAMWLANGAPQNVLPAPRVLPPQAVPLLPANLIGALLLLAMLTPLLVMTAIMALVFDLNVLAALLLLLLMVCVLLPAILLLVGVVRCCTPPEQVGARGWAAGALGSLLAEFILWGAAATLAVHMQQTENPDPSEAQWFLILLAAQAVVSLVFQACFFLLLRAVARHFGGRRLGAAFAGFLFALLFGMAAGVGLGAAFASGAVDAAVPWVQPTVGVAELVFNVALFLWLMYLLGRLRRLIPRG